MISKRIYNKIFKFVKNEYGENNLADNSIGIYLALEKDSKQNVNKALLQAMTENSETAKKNTLETKIEMYEIAKFKLNEALHLEVIPNIKEQFYVNCIHDLSVKIIDNIIAKIVKESFS